MPEDKEPLESIEAFIQALLYELTEFESRYNDHGTLTRSEWFEELMGFFEFNGLGNMKKAIQEFIDCVRDE